MQSNRIYMKFFMAVTVMLAVLMTVVGTTFYLASDHLATIRNRPVAEVSASIIADEQGHQPDFALETTRNYFNRVAQGINGLMWVTDSSGSVIFKTFEGAPPEPAHLFSGKGKEGAVPISLHDGTPGQLHFVFNDDWHKETNTLFFLGLAASVLTIALLSWPVANHVARPLNHLRQVMARFADGDLEARATMCRCGKGEIAMLGRDYNAMADSIVRMIESNRELSTNVSHEMRSPLARLTILQQTLAERLSKTDDTRAVALLRDMDQEIEAMDNLIGRILQFSKMHLRPEEYRDVNLVEMMSSVLETYAPRQQEKSIRLDVFAPAEVVCHVGEESMLWLLENVIGNAVKYTPENGRIVVTMRNEDNHGLIEVTNTADPLPETELESIFEPFQRGSNQTGQGSGLGLALVARIAENVGGTVLATNAATGFRLTVRVPSSTTA